MRNMPPERVAAWFAETWPDRPEILRDALTQLRTVEGRLIVMTKTDPALACVFAEYGRRFASAVVMYGTDPVAAVAAKEAIQSRSKTVGHLLFLVENPDDGLRAIYAPISLLCLNADGAADLLDAAAEWLNDKSLLLVDRPNEAFMAKALAEGWIVMRSDSWVLFKKGCNEDS